MFRSVAVHLLNVNLFGWSEGSSRCAKFNVKAAPRYESMAPTTQAPCTRVMAGAAAGAT